MSQGEQTFTWETPRELWRGLKSASPIWRGEVAAVYIAPGPAKPMISVAEVRALTRQA